MTTFRRSLFSAFHDRSDRSNDDESESVEKCRRHLMTSNRPLKISIEKTYRQSAESSFFFCEIRHVFLRREIFSCQKLLLKIMLQSMMGNNQSLKKSARYAIKNSKKKKLWEICLRAYVYMYIFPMIKERKAQRNLSSLAVSFKHTIHFEGYSRNNVTCEIYRYAVIIFIIPCKSASLHYNM